MEIFPATVRDTESQKNPDSISRQINQLAFPLPRHPSTRMLKANQRGKTMLSKEERARIARENGSKSRGPITPEGKKRVSQNPIKHGFYSQNIIIPGESHETYDQIKDAYVELLNPQTPIEHDLVTDIVNSRWLIRRADQLSTTAYWLAQDQLQDELVSYDEQPPDRIQYAFFQKAMEPKNYIEILLRMKEKHERGYHRALNKLEKLRKRKDPIPGVSPSEIEKNLPENSPAPDETPTQPQAKLTKVAAAIIALIALLSVLKPLHAQTEQANQRASYDSSVRSAMNLVQIEAADRILLSQIDSAVADAAQRSGEWLLCRPGCTQCCLGPFPITQLDALRLRTAMQQLNPSKAAIIRQRARDYIVEFESCYSAATAGIIDDDVELPEEMEDTPCPALDPDTGHCEVYAARPITCRAFGPPTEIEDGSYATCELCYVGLANSEIVKMVADIDPNRDESALVEALGEKGSTIVAYALTA